MLAIQQPPSGNLPLFLHIVGAIATFGATGTIALLGFKSRGREADREHWLRRLAFRVGVFVLIPAYILMRAAAQWIDSKEYPHGHEPGWVGVGFAVTDIGAILIIILLILAWLAARRRESRVAAVVPWLATVYVLALGVAWFAMSAKPGS
jgi:uncharacterized membrane protein (UPF0182 family)